MKSSLMIILAQDLSDLLLGVEETTRNVHDIEPTSAFEAKSLGPAEELGMARRCLEAAAKEAENVKIKKGEETGEVDDRGYQGSFQLPL